MVKSMIHGPQCICEICTCGRHQCPHNRNESSLNLSNGGTQLENQFRRKEYAVANERSTRVQPIKQKNEFSFVDSNGTKFDAKSVTQSEYSNKKGERFEIKPHRSSDIWKNEGKVESKTVNRNDYFNSKNVNEKDQIRGDRYPMKKPISSDLWKNEGKMESRSVNRSEYKATKGERFDMKRPQDSEILKSNENFDSESSNHNDYREKKGDRFDLKRPSSSEIWKATAAFSGESSNHKDYNQKKGERFDMKRPQDSEIFKNGESFAADSSSHKDYGQKTGERFDMKRPGSSEIWKGTAPFVAESSHRKDFAQKKGERYDPKRPESSNLWKSEAKMDKTTVSQDEFTKKIIEDPYIPHLPTNHLHIGNDINSEGTFTSVSHGDFQGKHGDPGSFPVHGAMQISSLSLGDNLVEFPKRTKSQDDFGLKVGQKLNAVRQENQLKIDKSLPFDSSSNYKWNFKASANPVPSRRAVRPSTALKLDGKRELTTDYQTEYHNKMEPCIAGELIESVKKNRSNTEHFNFKQVDKGHYFYQSKEDLTSI